MLRDDSPGEDLRVKRTHKLLQNALIALTVQKGFCAVAVSDIAKYAGLNRATFYRHYEDKFDLLNHYVQTVYEMLGASREDRPPESSEGNRKQIHSGLVTIFEHIQANAKFYRVMLGKNGDPIFAEKIRLCIQERIRRTLPPEHQNNQKNDDSVDLYLSYSSSASMRAVLWWLEHDMPYSPEQMATISYQIGMELSNLLERPQLYEKKTVSDSF